MRAAGATTRIDEVRFAGYECIRMSSDAIELIATHSVGPRVLSLRRPGRQNLFVQLPDETISRPGAAPFSFIGGHRLWVAPEVPNVTYAPDDASVDVTITGNSVALAAPQDAAGFSKCMNITLGDEGVTVGHEITNRNDEPRDVAAWAITQLVPGGTAIIPLGSTTPDRFQANASVVMWPYSDWDDPLVSIGRDHIEIDGRRLHPTKFGTALVRGWLAYKLGEHVFVKRAEHRDGRHADLGATGQCYAIRSFLELETLSNLVELLPGSTLRHTETWQVHDVDPGETGAAAIENLRLDDPAS